MFISEVFGSRKPEPAIFLAAAAHLGVEPTDMLFVGDNPETDILGAASVGMQTAWLHRGRAWPSTIATARPDYVIGSLSDLLWLTEQSLQNAAAEDE